MRKTLRERILNNVEYIESTECWRWLGPFRSKNGYGCLSVKNATHSAHVISYQELADGIIPKGFVVMHECNNKWCVNPNHLWVGTPKMNSEQAAKDGLYPRQSDLTIDQCNDIRSLYAGGNSSRKLGKIYKVSHTCILNIVNNKYRVSS